MNNYLSDHNTKAGTIGGSLLAFLLNVHGLHLLDTAITAAAGALVSFVVSVICRKALDSIKKTVRTREKKIDP